MKYLYIRIHTRPHLVWKARITCSDPMTLDLLKASKADQHLHAWVPHPDDEISDQYFDPPVEYCRRYLPKAPEKHCRWCLKPVPSHRHTWCGNACIESYAQIWDPHVLKRLAFARDRGVCQLCHRDTEQERKSVPKPGYYRTPRDVSAILALGYPEAAAVALSTRRVWYELDHVIPVVEGGGAGGVDNLRTLCWICHKAETKRLSVRSGERLREARVKEREWLSSLKSPQDTP